MALTIIPEEVRFHTRNTEHPDSVRVAQPTNPGQVVAPNADATSELYELSGGDGCGLVLTKATAANQTVAIAKQGESDLGSGIQALNDGAGIYVTPAGVLTDVATGNKLIGNVITVNKRRLARLGL